MSGIALSVAINSIVLRSIAVVSALLFAALCSAGVDEREQAKFLHDRLTGITPSNDMLNLMEASIVSGNPQQAARYAIDGNSAQGDSYGAVIASTGGFYNAVLKNWSAPWTNEAQDVFQPLNDYSATVIGLVRDADDFRKVLYDNIIYTGSSTLGISAYANNNNNHYEELEASSADMGNPALLVRNTQTAVTGIPAEGVAGVMTTRASARAYFIDGTNRAMFRFTVLNHLCNDLEQYRDNALPADRIRQDVSRSPGGDSSIYLNECASCHTGLDAMAQAFAYHQYQYPSAEQSNASEEQRKEMGEMVYTPGAVQEKYGINAGNFRPGFITRNDHWINYWRTGPNAQRIGWLNAAQNTSRLDEAVNPSYSEGDGAASLGQELANSDAFAYCQVQKAFETVCLRKPQQTDDAAAFSNIVSDFKNGYDMKQAFIDVAVHCSTTHLSTLNNN